MDRLVRKVERVTRHHSKWRDRVEIKANESLFRRLTRKSTGNGRKFSPELFDNVILRDGVDFLFFVASDVIPQKQKVGRSDIKIIVSGEAEFIAEKIEKHLKTGGPVGFSANIAQFLMGSLRFILKLQDHEDVERFMLAYQRADIKTSQDFIDFFQAHVDKYHVEE